MESKKNYKIKQLWLGKNYTTLIRTKNEYFLSTVTKKEYIEDSSFNDLILIATQNMKLYTVNEEWFSVKYYSLSQESYLPLLGFTDIKRITEKEAMQWLLTTENISS